MDTQPIPLVLIDQTSSPIESPKDDQFPSMVRMRSSVSSKIKKDLFEQKNELGPKYILFMVGLPARGKSYICRKLCRYLSWCGYSTKVFNVGNRRRLQANPEKMKSKPKQSLLSIQMTMNATHSPIIPAQPGSTFHTASFFDPLNADACVIRHQLAMETLDDIFTWLDNGGKVAIHDATNSTQQRREELLKKVASKKNVKALFIESICTDATVLEKNIQMKLQGPDYFHMDPENAIKDFKERIENYEKSYETINQIEEENGMSFIKLINVGKKIIANEIRGYLPSQCVLYLMQIHIKERTIWLTRHGESEYNVEMRIGGDASLTSKGREYADALSSFIKQQHPPQLSHQIHEEESDGLSIWTSTLKRAIESIHGFDSEEYHIQHIRALNELYAGSCENMTYTQVESTYPTEFHARKRNKLIYRYPGPGGESYADVIERLRPIIVELERMTSDVLVVTHQVVMRTLLAYFLGIPLQEMTTMSVPLHTLFCLQPKAYGADLIKCKFFFHLFIH